MSTRPLSLSVVILAAGQGKRMKSDLPKVLQPLAGRPLLKHVIDSARELEPTSVHVVYGHGGDRVREVLKAEQVSWVLQAEQLGTGHAVMQAAPKLDDSDVVLVLYGDVPLIRSATLNELLSLANTKSMSVLTVLLEDPTGYGRIVRDRIAVYVGRAGDHVATRIAVAPPAPGAGGAADDPTIRVGLMYVYGPQDPFEARIDDVLLEYY